MTANARYLYFYYKTVDHITPIASGLTNVLYLTSYCHIHCDNTCADMIVNKSMQEDSEIRN